MQKTHEIAGKTIVVTELTVADIRQLLIDSTLQSDSQNMTPEQQADTILDKMLLPGVDLAAVRQITGLDRDGLAGFNQSELQSIADHCRALNPLFFGMLARLEEAKQRAEITALSNLQWKNS